MPPKLRFHVCPNCGFPIVNEEISWLFRGKQRVIYETVARAGVRGIARADLVETVYGNDSDGGPLSANNSIAVMINKAINSRLAPHGLKITAGRGRGMQPYRLVTLPRERRR